MLNRLRKIQKGRINAPWTSRTLKVRLKIKTWRMPNMRDNPLSLSETQDPELQLLLLLNLLRIFKMMQRKVESKSQSKKSKKLLMISMPSYHKMLIRNS